MSAVDTFIKKTETATKARSKDIRISLLEAQTLVTELAGMLEKENKLLDKIVNLQDTAPQVTAAAPTGEVVMDGGSFKK